MIPRLPLSPNERANAIKILFKWVDSEKSGIVKTFSLQALADLSTRDDNLKKVVREKLEHAVKNGAPAMAARARKLLKTFGG